MEAEQKSLDNHMKSNKTIQHYGEHLDILKKKLDEKSKQGDFDETLKKQIEMTMLDINAAKIKAEGEIEKLKQIVKRKNEEIHTISSELLKAKKQNTQLEGIVSDMQSKLDEKDKTNQELEDVM